MSLFELAAIAAAMTWAFSAVIAAGPSAELGAIAFNRLRMGIVFVVLAASWRSPAAGARWKPLMSCRWRSVGLHRHLSRRHRLFLTMNRLGPRRSNILFSTNAPISAVLGWLFLGETIVGQKIVGIAIVFAGVIMAIVFGKRRSQLSTWETVKGPLPVGIALGLGGALPVDRLPDRPARDGNRRRSRDRLDAARRRIGDLPVGADGDGHQAGSGQGENDVAHRRDCRPVRHRRHGHRHDAGSVRLSGGKVGIVATLSATTPAWILPLIWIRTGERPAAMAWLGAALVIVGSSLIFAA
jgi:drug/metabolite transporter (DMT)-like permease